MSLVSVKAFYKKLANDEAFRGQIQGVKSKEECRQIVKAAGYDFTQEEFEEYTAQLLESEAAEGELQDLGEKELEAVVGGFTANAIQMIYGGPIDQFIDRPCPPVSQPLYGVIQSDVI